MQVWPVLRQTNVHEDEDEGGFCLQTGAIYQKRTTQRRDSGGTKFSVHFSWTSVEEKIFAAAAEIPHLYVSWL